VIRVIREKGKKEKKKIKKESKKKIKKENKKLKHIQY